MTHFPDRRSRKQDRRLCNIVCRLHAKGQATTPVAADLLANAGIDVEIARRLLGKRTPKVQPALPGRP